MIIKDAMWNRGYEQPYPKLWEDRNSAAEQKDNKPQALEGSMNCKIQCASFLKIDTKE